MTLVTPGKVPGRTAGVMSAEPTLEPAGVGQRVVGRSARVASLLLWTVLVALLGLGLTARWNLRRTQPLDFDEFQHLHAAWCWTQGLMPYHDFWDNHPPLLQVILACLQPIGGETVETIFLARLAMFAAALGVFGVTFGLARAAFDSATGLAAVALLACVQVFTDKTVEVRPDTGLILFSVLAVWLLLRALQTESLRTAFAFCAAAGLAFGLATLFSTKSMMLAVALLVALTALAVRRRHALRLRVRPETLVFQPARGLKPAARWVSGRTLKAVFGGAGLFALGFLTAVLPCCIFLAIRDGLGDMLRFTIIDTVCCPERFSAMRWLRPTWSTPLAVILSLGMLLILIEQFRKPPHRDASFVLLTLTAVLVVQFALVMPAPYAQSVCLSVAFLVIPAGWLLRSAIGWITDPRRSTAHALCGGAAALAIVLAGPADSLLHSRLSHQGDAAELKRQLAETRRVLDLTGPNDAVFGESPVAIFRRHACFHPALTYAALQRYRRGDARTSIAEDLRRYGCTLIVESYPPRPIPEGDRAFIRDHFVPSGPSVRVPGQQYSLAQLSDGPVTFDAVAAGVYQVEATVAVRVDGHPAAAEVFLDAGSHTIECTKEPGPVRIHRRPGQ